jgi:hypothetical protein
MYITSIPFIGPMKCVAAPLSRGMYKNLETTILGLSENEIAQTKSRRHRSKEILQN